MDFEQIAILAVIVGVFATFGVVLASVTWYCRPRPVRRAPQHDKYPFGGGLITDDD